MKPTELIVVKSEPSRDPFPDLDIEVLVESLLPVTLGALPLRCEAGPASQPDLLQLVVSPAPVKQETGGQHLLDVTVEGVEDEEQQVSVAVVELQRGQLRPDDLVDAVLVRGGVRLYQAGRHPGEAQWQPAFLGLGLVLGQNHLGQLVLLRVPGAPGRVEARDAGEAPSPGAPQHDVMALCPRSGLLLPDLLKVEYLAGNKKK